MLKNLKKFAMLVLAGGMAIGQNPQSAVYPVGVATDNNLYVASNRAGTVLTSNIGSADTTIPVASTASFTVPTMVLTGTEVIAVCSKTSVSFTVCANGRGYDSTSAAAHSSGLAVSGAITSRFFNQTAAELKALETYAVNSTGAYVNPSWITSLAGSKLTGIAGSNGQVLTSNGSGGFGTPVTPLSQITGGCALSGGVITTVGTFAVQVTVNVQSSTSYTYQAGDCGKLVSHSNAAAIAATLPQATGPFGTNFYMFVQNTGAGTLTITPTTSTIDGASTLALTTGQGVLISSNGTNYFTMSGKGSGGGGGSGGPNFLTLSISGGGLVFKGAVSNCASGTPCYVSVGNGKRITYTNNGSCSPASGNDTWFPWVDKSGNRNVGYSTVVPTCTNATAVAAITSEQTGDGNIVMGQVTVSSGAVTVVPVAQAVQSGTTSLTASTNITIACTDTGCTFSAPGGTPAGSNKELQYNNSGAFGAVGSSDVSGTNFIIPRNGTFGTNGRVVVGQDGSSGDGRITVGDHFGNPFQLWAQPNAVGEAYLWLGPGFTSGVVSWYRGAIQLIPGGAQYTCDSTTRGMFFVTNSSAGVKDKVEVCTKDAANTYAWRTIY